MSPDARQLRRLLGRWKTPGLDHSGGFRFHDAPPDAVRRALAAVDPFMTVGRPNGQPPAGWLVDVDERLGGLLAGQVGGGAGLARTRFGRGGAGPERWDAEQPVWTGGARDLLDEVPPGVLVVGLWWD